MKFYVVSGLLGPRTKWLHIWQKAYGGRVYFGSEERHGSRSWKKPVTLLPRLGGYTELSLGSQSSGLALQVLIKEALPPKGSITSYNVTPAGDQVLKKKMPVQTLHIQDSSGWGETHIFPPWLMLPHKTAMAIVLLELSKKQYLRNHGDKSP